MAQEKEIKFFLKKDLELFIKDIVDQGYVFNGQNVTTQDIYLDTADWSLYNSIAALRVRLKDQKIHSLSFKKFFCIKNKVDDPWYIEELEVKFPLVETETLQKILTILGITVTNLSEITPTLNTVADLLSFFSQHGFTRQIKINKNRRIFFQKDTEICVDNVEKLGTLIEIESKNEDPIKITNALLNNSEWERSIEGISNIFMRINYGQDKHLHYMKNFETDPTWNVWPTEAEWYQKLTENINHSHLDQSL